ncbi:hypothetical protein Tco_0850028 [Tanacetum coccineum]
MAASGPFNQANSVIDLRWSFRTKFDLLVFLQFRILMQIIKTISIEEITAIKQRKQFSTRSRICIACPVHHQYLIKDQPSGHTEVFKNRFLKDMSHNDAVLRNMQNPASFYFRFWKRLHGNTNTVTNPKEDLKGITTRSGVTIQGPKAVNHDTEVTKDTMPPTNNGSTEDVQPPVVQIQTRNPNPEPNVAPVIPPVPKASIPFPSRRNDERRKEKANDQIEKF